MDYLRPGQCRVTQSLYPNKNPTFGVILVTISPDFGLPRKPEASKIMNIGIVCYPTYGGSGVVATELGKALAQRGHTIHFITYNRPIRLDLFSENIFYHQVRTPNYPLFEFSPYESALASAMVEVARFNDIDLFHVHYAIPHASVAFLAQQILRGYNLDIPFITTLHGTDITLVGKDKGFEPVVRFSIEKSDGVTAVSDFLKKDTIDHFGIENEIQVIPNFVDTERFQPHDKDHFRKMIATHGEKLLVHTSNFRRVKRIKDVIKVFARVKEQVPAKLLMVGDGPERGPAEDFCREMKLCDHIIFLGNQNAVEEIYSVGDLFIIPSGSESFGLSALEAMSCGVPVISSNAGGLPEVVVDGKNGFVSPIGDVDKMAADSLSLLQDDDKWEAFSLAARQHAEQFTRNAIVPQYEAYYSRVIKERKTAVKAL
jgi:N-acetyl-alpha-D-glucosaminyl L-malate synthase BshA